MWPWVISLGILEGVCPSPLRLNIKIPYELALQPLILKIKLKSFKMKWKHSFPDLSYLPMSTSRDPVLKACTQRSSLTLTGKIWTSPNLGTQQYHREQACVSYSPGIRFTQSSILNLPSYKLESPREEPALHQSVGSLWAQGWMPGSWISPGEEPGCRGDHFHKYTYFPPLNRHTCFLY